MSEFNGFDKNLQFTVDKFDDSTPHFLNLEIHQDGLGIYRKATHTGQFTNFDSFIKWNYKVSWICALVTRAKKICSSNKLANEIANIRQFCSFNGFPKWVSNRIIKKFLRNNTDRNHAKNKNEDNITTLYMSLPYLGDKSEQSIRNTKRQLQRLFKTPDKIKFNIQTKSTKLSFYTSNKERIAFLSNSHVVYRYQCPGCAKSYVGKTDTTLFRRSNQHGWTQKDSAIFQHFARCDAYQSIIQMFQIDDHDIDVKEFQINTVRDNLEILHRCDNWSQLTFLESLTIKEFKPKLNDGFKGTKEPQLY